MIFVSIMADKNGHCIKICLKGLIDRFGFHFEEIRTLFVSRNFPNFVFILSKKARELPSIVKCEELIFCSVKAILAYTCAELACQKLQFRITVP